MTSATAPTLSLNGADLASMRGASLFKQTPL